VQALEGELEVEVPQVREAAEPLVSKLFACSTKVLRTEPLRAMVIGAFVRGLSLRDIESLCEKAGLGQLSKTTASRICTELRERLEQFKRRDLYDVELAALFLDAVFLSVRPDGPKEGVLVVAWGFPEQGERVLLQVMRGMRESHEDWLELGRDLIARGLGAPLLVIADGAPGLIAEHEPARTIARRGQTPHQGDRPLARRDQLPHPRLVLDLYYITHAQERRPLQPARTPTPTPRATRRKRTNDPRARDRRLD
jgi:transposase-like protein